MRLRILGHMAAVEFSAFRHRISQKYRAWQGGGKKNSKAVARGSGAVVFYWKNGGTIPFFGNGMDFCLVRGKTAAAFPAAKTCMRMVRP